MGFKTHFSKVNFTVKKNVTWGEGRPEMCQKSVTYYLNGFITSRAKGRADFFLSNENLITMKLNLARRSFTKAFQETFFSYFFAFFVSEFRQIMDKAILPL